METIVIITVAVLAGFGALAPILLVRMRAAPTFAKVVAALIFALPILVVWFFPAVTSRLGQWGRIFALASFGIAFSVAETAARRRKTQRDRNT